MPSLMRLINRTSRLANIYRSARLSGTQEEGGSLNACHHIYIFHICRNPGISQEQLARRICVNKSNVTRHLSALEQSGYVTRTADPDDRRVMQVWPTAKAEAMFPRVRSLMQEWEEELLSDFTEEEKNSLLSLMERVMNRAAALVDQTVPEESDPQ